MKLERGKPPSKWIVRTVIGLVIVSQVAALIGDLNTALLFDRYPGLLIALNPRNRILALTSIHLEATPFYLIGFFRLVASDPLYYLLGYWFGDRAIAWTERRSKTYGPLVREGERYFRRAAYPLIFFMPNNIICALSAVTGVRLGAFITLNVTGTIARLILVRQFSERFESPLQGIGGFIAEYRLPIFLLSAVAVAWTVYSEFFSGNSEAQSLVDLGRDESEDGESTLAESPLDEVPLDDGSVARLEVEDPVEPDG